MLASGEAKKAFESVKAALAIPGYSRREDLLSLHSQIGLKGQVVGFNSCWQRRVFERRGESSIALIPHSSHVLTGYRDGTLSVAELEGGKPLKRLEGHRDSVHSVAVSKEGQLALSGSSDKTLRVWEIKTGKCLRTLKGHTK